MNALYPDEPKKLNVITHLEEFRKRVLISLGFVAAASVFTFSNGDRIMALVKKPVAPVIGDLIYISPTEAFVAYLKVSLLSGFIISFPVILYHTWAYVSPAINNTSKTRVLGWFLTAFFLFFAGICFSYFIAIPAALDFLIGFGSSIAVPRITVGKYISFFGALILSGGIIFEIPVIISVMTEAGFINSNILRRKRHIAVLVILIISAIITPTQDIINMLIFSIPMVVLYEAGVLISRYIERGKRRGSEGAEDVA